VKVLLVGGLDPSGRAGLLADVETVRSLGAQAAAVATCLTAQGGRRYRSQAASPKMLDAQLDAVGRVDAIKIGAVPDRPALIVISHWVRMLRVPTVVDPVLRTSRGERLSTLKPRDYALLRDVVLTPNVDEFEIATAIGSTRFVLKSLFPASDAVIDEGRVTLLKGKPLPRDPKHHRGTGCRFASALAVHLARGETLVQAARGARRFVRKFLAAPIIRAQ
jgi:hydroxymethylpyrimidine/phosphomethylpyrimidine kinase